MAGGGISTERARGKLWLHGSGEPNTGWDLQPLTAACPQTHLASWLDGRVVVIIKQVQLVS